MREELTPKRGFRRRLLQRGLVYGGLAAAGGVGWWRWRGGDREVVEAGLNTHPHPWPAGFAAPRNHEFDLDRAPTDRVVNARYTNFYEFSITKRNWAHVATWELDDWKLEVTGLCANPTTFSLDDLARRFAAEERVYRHRCVEAWAMVAPWTGFPLRRLIEFVRPLPEARFVRFVSFDHTQASGARRDATTFPWPYKEGLTLPEATNELTLIATGMYGQPLLKQHGAPLRLVVPWKYGFKSAKSLVRIELTKYQPFTFWNTYAPDEYSFEANVDPQVPHPRWSQATERDIETGERRPTVLYNGYGDYVAALYSR